MTSYKGWGPRSPFQFNCTGTSGKCLFYKIIWTWHETTENDIVGEPTDNCLFSKCIQQRWKFSHQVTREKKTSGKFLVITALPALYRMRRRFPVYANCSTGSSTRDCVPFGFYEYRILFCTHATREHLWHPGIFWFFPRYRRATKFPSFFWILMSQGIYLRIIYVDEFQRTYFAHAKFVWSQKNVLFPWYL